MKTHARFVVCFVATFAALGQSAIARADAPGDAFLARVDQKMSNAKTLQLEYEIVTKEAGKEEHKLAMQVTSVGEKWRAEFLAPKDMEGTKVLVLSTAQMYVYLPAFGRVRRIASHASDAGFMGLTFGLDELSTSSYGAHYSARIASEDTAGWRLILTAKPGLETPWARIEMQIGKASQLPTELKYFDSSGTNARTETRSNYTCEGDVCTAGERLMTDIKGSSTRMVVKNRKVNAVIADDVFTKRNLEK